LSKEGQPRRDQANAYSSEQGGGHKEGNADTPRAPLTQEQQGWYNRPHEELVKLFRSHRELLEQESKQLAQRVKYRMSPEDFLAAELYGQTNSPNKEKSRFFSPIHDAWSVVALERFRFGSKTRYIKHNLVLEYPGTATIKLDPNQVKVIDALAEAFDIPHKRGQTEIPIPEKIRQATQKDKASK
jgi:hypothetical protein